MKKKENNGEETVIFCNCCGRRLKMERGIEKEEYITIKKAFGYFSSKDGVEQEFEVCESCYDKWVSSFSIPVKETEMTELL